VWGLSNLRIARHIRTESGVLIRTEVGGEFMVAPGDTKRISQVRQTLAEIQAEEPTLGWQLETRGTDSNWHEWKD
jgi:hypothetical protein